MNIITWTTTLCFLFLWNHVQMQEKQCQAVRSVSIERVNGAHGIVSQVTVNYGTFTTCLVVENSAITGYVNSTSNKLCPPESSLGYEYFPGVGYYKFHKNPNTWDGARKLCEQEGGHLAVINSEQESKVIQQYLAAAPKLEHVNHNDFAFVGFHDRFVEGDQITVFGTSLGSTGFTRWAGPGQADNAGGNENCGSVHRNGGLNDIPCHWKLAFFCEKEPRSCGEFH